MIIDSSALVSALIGEKDAEELIQIIADSQNPCISAANYLESGVVLDSRKDPVLSRSLDEFLQVAGVEIVPVTVEQARIARDAYRDFGKGSGHPAQLNFGDCFSYALAKATTEPLLYVGLDFSHTDVAAARIQ
ncbi:MAG: PIN domain-containing protein [Actinobacteria bacterium]|uniref:Unannotated protein n=1 Tax=freshwater metagenome TaxID=449393 RepID=A0A6J7DIN0_9ZZZZ|nr:PIN domain-containing protein [Actinomycetota bacterium]MSX64607.1 PIN domain-containing protein [Actinomycetota bacterium]